MQTIALLSGLPTLTCTGMVIDGYTQPGASRNTSSTGFNANLLIEIDGGSAGPVVNGFDVQAAVRISGLIIDNFASGSAVLVPSGPFGQPVITGNYLGDPSGTGAKRNGFGVDTLNGSPGALLGGPTVADRNVLSGNGQGVSMSGNRTCTVQNNLIGVDATGAAANANLGWGLTWNCSGNVLVTDNTISGNGSDGIVAFSSATGLIQRNKIGTDSTGVAAIPNNGYGINVQNTDAQIGGSLANANVIAFNRSGGVFVNTIFVPIRFNSIFQNGGRGIDLKGVAPSLDACDNDFGAGNELQNYPVIASAQLSGGTLTLTGSLDSVSNRSFDIDFYTNLPTDNPSNASGRTWIGTVRVPASNGPPCAVPFTTSVAYGGALGDLITATATDTLAFNTSWFSVATAVTAAPATVPGAPLIGTATAGNAQATVTFSPPASDGGSPITRYTATSSPGGFTASGTGSPLTVTGLTNGTAYSFTVTATNAIGTSLPSSPTSPVIPSAALPTLTLTPVSLTFSARTVLTTSAPQAVTIANNGPGAVSIRSMGTSGDYAFVSGCPGSLAALATCTVDVTFTPLVAGARPGTLTIASSASGSPQVVALSGTGQSVVVSAPDILVTPGVNEFGAQGIGTDSLVQTITVNSTGTAPLTLGAIDTTLADFVLKPASVGAGRSCGTTLAPGDSCDVAVAFHPTAEGIRDGQLRVVNNASGLATVRIVGRGIIVAPPRPLTVPAQLTFGPTPVGVKTNGLSLPIVNNTASAVSVTGLTASGDFTVSDTCATIAGLGTCTPLVFFQPTAVGDRSASIAIHALADTVPYVVNLSGSGVVNPVPALGLSATRIGFGNVLVGTLSTNDVTLTNIGMVPVALNSIGASGDFLESHACGSTLAVGQSCLVHVELLAWSGGGKSGSLVVVSNAAGSPHRIDLSGTACLIPSYPRSRIHPLLCAP